MTASREHQRAAPPVFCTDLFCFNVNETGLGQPFGPLLNGQQRHVDVERRSPFMAGGVFRVVVHSDDGSTSGAHPFVVKDAEKRQRLLKVVQAFHAVNQIDRFGWLPIRKHGFDVVAIGVDGPGFGDHRRGAVHTGCASAQRMCIESSDHPAVAATDVNGRKGLFSF